MIMKFPDFDHHIVVVSENTLIKKYTFKYLESPTYSQMVQEKELEYERGGWEEGLWGRTWQSTKDRVNICWQ